MTVKKNNTRIHFAVRDDISCLDFGTFVSDLDWDLAKVVNRDETRGIPQQKAYENYEAGYNSLIFVINDHLPDVARIVIEGEDAGIVAAELGLQVQQCLVTFAEAGALLENTE